MIALIPRRSPAHIANRFIVMAERRREFLETIYGVDPEKIDLIPNGVIDMPFIDSDFYKDLFHVEGKTVLLTFGLLSRNKGIEHVIEALPAILERTPNVVYLVLGATHPNVLAADGESYRESLERLALELGVAEHVHFHNRYVTLEELKEFIGAADIYLTPYLNEAQIASGMLAYAFGAGKALISTSYWHAQELLADERGLVSSSRRVSATSPPFPLHARAAPNGGTRKPASRDDFRRERYASLNSENRVWSALRLCEFGMFPDADIGSKKPCDLHGHSSRPLRRTAAIRTNYETQYPRRPTPPGTQRPLQRGIAACEGSPENGESRHPSRTARRFYRASRSNERACGTPQ